MSISRMSPTRANPQYYQYWVEIISKYQESGLTQRQYCESAGIKFTTFRNWLYCLKEPDLRGSNIQRGTFEPLVITPESPPSTERQLTRNNSDVSLSSPSLEIRFSAGLSIVVSSGFHEETLKHLIQVVRGLDV